jgi:hypothetical protein
VLADGGAAAAIAQGLQFRSDLVSPTLGKATTTGWPARRDLDNDHVASSLHHATQHRDVEGQELIDSPEDQGQRTAAHHQKNA